jgi:hypothetical protein
MRMPKSMKPPSARLVRNLWVLAALVFLGSLLIFLAVFGKNVLEPDSWWSPGSLAGGLFWYCISGWCLIPLPFVLAAIVASLTAKAKPEDKVKVRRVVTIAVWGIVVVVIGLAILFLLFFLMIASSGGHFYKA